MQLHQIAKIKKRRKRIGRGGKRGSYSGRGMKGQKSRAGTHKMEPLIRRAIKRYPKLRGYNFNRMEDNLVVVNLEVLDKKFKESETVNPQSLLKKGIIRRIKGRAPKVKILGKGKLEKALAIEECQISKSAKKAVEEKGGKVN